MENKPGWFYSPAIPAAAMDSLPDSLQILFIITDRANILPAFGVALQLLPADLADRLSFCLLRVCHWRLSIRNLFVLHRYLHPVPPVSPLSDAAQRAFPRLRDIGALLGFEYLPYTPSRGYAPSTYRLLFYYTPSSSASGLLHGLACADFPWFRENYAFIRLQGPANTVTFRGRIPVEIRGVVKRGGVRLSQAADARTWRAAPGGIYRQGVNQCGGGPQWASWTISSRFRAGRRKR